MVKNQSNTYSFKDLHFKLSLQSPLFIIATVTLRRQLEYGSNRQIGSKDTPAVANQPMAKVN
jgi:hypothetical protein